MQFGLRSMVCQRPTVFFGNEVKMLKYMDEHRPETSSISHYPALEVKAVMDASGNTELTALNRTVGQNLFVATFNPQRQLIKRDRKGELLGPVVGIVAQQVFKDLSTFEAGQTEKTFDRVA